uniref:Alpha-macroglobulin receptor-binding domain-containing protein n=1 Tax=Anopheles epiroticus TaxID=199890 RepID=A0A182P1M2_9DIPT
MDTVPSTFEIENIGREEGDVIVSTTINPRHTQLYVIPSAWSNTAGDEEALQLDIITSSGTDEEARLTGQIQLAQQPKVLIQLSDVLHTPGDFLNYRIFLANELNQALPRTERPLNVTIALEHEWQHTVESREVVLFPGEMYSGEHLFVDDRDLGDWNLTVTVGEQTTSKQFKVILYSAPIYDIKIGTDEIVTLQNRKATFQYNPPPHINQMIVTAFVCSPTRGLGIAEPVQWQRQQDIEIYLHIPYSAKKLEPVTVDVYITNNREEVKYVVVDLLNNANEFSFLENGGRTDATKKSVLGRLQPNEVQRAEFLIRPKKLGSITLKANAYTEGNEVARAETILRTVPESVQRTGSIVRLFNVDNSKEQYTDVKIPIPRTIDTGSEKISFALHREQVQIASLSASMLLDKLVQSDPFTMAMRASLTLEVLALGRLEWKERRALAERMMNESVTKIVSYANADGSFTIPEQHTPSSACWDTVIALQALTFTNEHLESGELEELILKALEWMRTRQAPQGFFCTDDGGPQNDLQQIEKTAHVLSLFLHMKSHIWRYVSVINDARIYLLQSTPKLRDPYHLALVGHVFQLSLQRPTGKKDHSLINEKVTHILAELLDRKQQSPSGLKLWWNTGSTPDLDATGYALMVMTSKKYLFNAAPIVNWIKGQPYRRVMNVSITHNSHIALRALIDYSKHTTFLEKKYTAVIVPKGKSEVFAQQELHHDSGSHVLTLPSATRSVSFTINGTISGAFEITYSYMESVTLQTQKFDIDVMRYGTSNEDYTDWRVCVRFLPRGSYEKTQMVTCEISFPTGYIALDDSVDELNQLEDVVATTLRNDETQLSITFEEIGVQQKCFNVTGFKRNEETRQLPGTIRVFDLADSTNIAYKQLDTKT